MAKITSPAVTEVANHIHFIRGNKVMLDFDLAVLYQVETRALKQAVRRNKDRFPNDFMLILTPIEVNDLVSQNVIPSRSHLGGAKPMAFSEQGVAMLSTVLKSKQALQANIAIMRAFVQMRHLVESNKELDAKLTEMEKKYDEQFKTVFDAIKELIHQKSEPRERIGFKKDVL